MKKLLLLGVVAIVSLAAQAGFSKAILKASGLTCALCSNAINKSLEKLPFVEVVKSDIKNMVFNISFRQNEEVHIDLLRRAVEDAGFSVASLQLTGNFAQQEIENDKHIKIGNNYFHFLNTDNQLLQGERTLTIVDKHFVTTREFKKVRTYTKLPCLETGKSTTCCPINGIREGERIFHVTI